jgi:hypothetical protein
MRVLCSMHDGHEKAICVFGKPKGKRELRRPTHNTKMDHKEVGCSVYGLGSSGSGKGQKDARAYATAKAIRFRKRRGMYRPGEAVSASQEGPCSVEFAV